MQRIGNLVSNKHDRFHHLEFGKFRLVYLEEAWRKRGQEEETEVLQVKKALYITRSVIISVIKCPKNKEG